MKIDTAEIMLSSAHSEKVEHESSKEWKVVPEGGWLAFNDMYAGWKQVFSQDKADSTALRAVPDVHGHQPRGHAARKLECEASITQMLLDILSGRPQCSPSIRNVDDVLSTNNGLSSSPGRPKAEVKPVATPVADAPPVADSFKLEFVSHEKTIKSERTEFSAAGKVKTADGRQISLHLNSVMMRQEMTETGVSGTVEVEKLKDPLVVNLDGKGVRFSADRLLFDLEGKGAEVKIPVMTSGSGFLVLDANGNGRADSGLELFGTQSGNGFADLAAWDDDRNRWIDENDKVFSQLNVWRGGDGNSLESLSKSGIGAIYLGNVASEFSFLDQGKHLQAMVRESGIFLNEDGTPGVIQQIDLVV